MKAIIIPEPEAKARPFPKIMISDMGAVVFMLNDVGMGVVISPDVDHPIGDYAGFDESDNWSMERFRDFEGSVTLSND